MKSLDRLGGMAPVALFVYRRHELLHQVLAALQACDGYADTPVFVFSDGYKGEADRRDVETVRDIVEEKRTPNMTIVPAAQNAGLDPAIIAGVGHVLSEYDRVIVLEDDLSVAPQILRWFNAALERYADTTQVMQVAGHVFDAPPLADRTEGLFLPFGTSWGWATWRRAWDRFDADAAGWEALLTDRRLRRRFNLNGAYDYTRLMRNQMAAPPSKRAWDIRWYWSLFREGGLCLFPPQTLVLNLGFGGRATHSHLRTRLLNMLRPVRALATSLPGTPSSVMVEEPAYAAIRRAIRWRRL